MNSSTKVKILDCTLRDGGYYTNWDFDKSQVELYLNTLSKFDIDYLEVGYRSPTLHGYFGEYYYTPLETLRWIAQKIGKNTKLALMLNTKDCSADMVSGLLEDCRQIVSLVRLATDPLSIEKAATIARVLKSDGFEVGLNIMYLSRNKGNDKIIHQIKAHQEYFDFVYLVDSFGSCLPHDVFEEAKTYKSNLKSKIGFHGHNNIELAFANALSALQAGTDIIDATVLGMGRGAGNLSTELVLSYLSKKEDRNLDLSDLSELVTSFKELQKKYGWGTVLPYMISGFADLPQKDVMDWLSKRRYTIPTIVKALQGNKTVAERPNITPPFTQYLKKTTNSSSTKKCATCVIVGGGTSASVHYSAISSLVQKGNTFLIHSSLKHVTTYFDHPTPQLICLAGAEQLKVSRIKSIENKKSLSYLIAEPPRLYSSVPTFLEAQTYEVPVFEPPANPSSTLLSRESPLGLALGTATALGCEEIALVGFDGYTEIESNSSELAREVQVSLDAFKLAHPLVKLYSLTPSKYEIDQKSVYSMLSNGIQRAHSL